MILTVLEEFIQMDHQTLISWIDSPGFLVQWAGPVFSYPLNSKQLEKHCIETSREKPISKVFKAIDRSSNKMVGYIELNRIDYKNESATVSRVLVGEKQLCGKGIGTQMMKSILYLALSEMNLHRVELIVFDFNEPTIKIYKKLGFQIEGHLRDYRKVDNKYWSAYLMSILKEEWELNNQLKADTG